ncbi:hypothetical protein CAPTEDRAFT_176233 [Capitella teleta]|uniref:Uncharacterized protein n=1 Tax=Capitella teleta TaxID=283909 RepID=R7U607_CAPTE|nr:hypothetical protein CAPTEDRAFT_176233 [Capitella teleta]|eukprot:ELU01800.1 hypothetical protein CAPTEDRAFT_176233 [Capitella teleta]
MDPRDTKEKIPWTKRDGKRWLFEGSITLSSISAFFFLIGFSTPNWIVSWPRVYSGFKSIGLHHICLAGMVLPADPDQIAYHGCWWIFSDNLDDIQTWIWPAWFAYTIAAMCFCFIFEAVSLILVLLLWVKTGRFQRKTDQKKKENLCMLQTATALTVAAAFLESLTLLVFALMFYQDRNWLPNQHFNYLSYSYGLTLVSCFMSIFSAIAQVTYVLIIRQEMREPPREVNLQGYMPPMLSTSMHGGSRNLLDKSASASKATLPQYDPRTF